MLSKRITTLLTVLLVFCCSVIWPPTPHAGATKSGVGVGRVNSSTVEITFDGLMVFHKLGNHYEVGILDAVATPAPHHKFAITVDDVPVGNDVEALKALGNAWVLEVARGDAGVNIHDKHHTTRFDDSEETKEDFTWIIDLESSEFQNEKLDLFPGKLKPIIQLSKGELFTKYKTHRLKRKRGIGAFDSFGFVADKIGLRLNLSGEEELVLKVVGEGKNGEAFRLKANESHPYYKVAIRNVMNHEMVKAKIKTASEPSHFQYYYKLFDNVSKFKRFEFEKEYKPSINSRDTMGDFSKTLDSSKCCPYICGQLLLGKMDHPLW